MAEQKYEHKTLVFAAIFLQAINNLINSMRMRGFAPRKANGGQILAADHWWDQRPWPGWHWPPFKDFHRKVSE